MCAKKVDLIEVLICHDFNAKQNNEENINNISIIVSFKNSFNFASIIDFY